MEADIQIFATTDNIMLPAAIWSDALTALNWTDPTTSKYSWTTVSAANLGKNGCRRWRREFYFYGGCQSLLTVDKKTAQQLSQVTAYTGQSAISNAMTFYDSPDSYSSFYQQHSPKGHHGWHW